MCIRDRYSGHSEDLQIVLEFVIGDKIDIRTHRNTNPTFYMAPSYSYFYGNLLNESATSVDSNTALTVQSLNIGSINVKDKILSIENQLLSPLIYAFSVTSNFNGNRSYNNAVLEFNSISYDGYFVKPDTSAYNFHTFQYTVPINGVWSIGCRIYIQ